MLLVEVVQLEILIIVILYMLVGALAGGIIMRVADEEERELPLFVSVFLFWPILLVILVVLGIGRSLTALSKFLEKRFG